MPLLALLAICKVLTLTFTLWLSSGPELEASGTSGELEGFKAVSRGMEPSQWEIRRSHWGELDAFSSSLDNLFGVHEYCLVLFRLLREIDCYIPSCNLEEWRLSFTLWMCEESNQISVSIFSHSRQTGKNTREGLRGIWTATEGSHQAAGAGVLITAQASSNYMQFYDLIINTATFCICSCLYE